MTVNNEYNDEELQENPPNVPKLDCIVRNILAEKPRVTRFPCEFDAISTEDGQQIQEEIITEGFGNENNVMFDQQMNNNVVMGAGDGVMFDQGQPQQTDHQPLMDPTCSSGVNQQQPPSQPSQPLW